MIIRSRTSSEVAGLLKEEGGKLIPLAPEPRSIPETVEKTLSISDTMPPVTRLQRNLSMSYNNLGDVQVQQGGFSRRWLPSARSRV